jgi:hypothetical protein
MGLLLDALTELEHLSLKLQVKVNFSETSCVSITQNPGESYEKASNASKKLKFQETEFGKAHMSQQYFFQKPSVIVNVCMFTIVAPHMCSGRDRLSNKDKYSQFQFGDFEQNTIA